MLCGICGKEFEPKHFNQKLCSEECKQQAKRNSKEKYKKSEKGKEATKRWHQSERFKENEKRYRQNPIARHKAVIRQKEYLKTHPEAVEKKRKGTDNTDRRIKAEQETVKRPPNTGRPKRES